MPRKTICANAAKLRRNTRAELYHHSFFIAVSRGFGAAVARRSRFYGRQYATNVLCGYVQDNAPVLSGAGARIVYRQLFLRVLWAHGYDFLLSRRTLLASFTVLSDPFLASCNGWGRIYRLSQRRGSAVRFGAYVAQRVVFLPSLSPTAPFTRKGPTA